MSLFQSFLGNTVSRLFFFFLLMYLFLVLFVPVGLYFGVTFLRLVSVGLDRRGSVATAGDVGERV